VLSDQFARQAEEFFATSKGIGLPANVQSIVEDGVAKSREAYLKINSVTKDGVKAFEDAMTTAYTGAKTISEKIMLNTEANTKAAFDAAQSISRAKTLPEVVHLQSSYMQKQVADFSAQAKEFYELSTKVAQQTFEAMSSAYTKNLDQLKKVG
jgi:phasin